MRLSVPEGLQCTLTAKDGRTCVCLAPLCIFHVRKETDELAEKQSRGLFILTHACVTCIARACVTTARRYCIGSSGPSHLFCHVKGH